MHGIMGFNLGKTKAVVQLPLALKLSSQTTEEF